MAHVPGTIDVPSMRVDEVTLTGNWVILEPLRVAHADELYPDAMEPQLFQFIAPGVEQTKKGVQDWIEARLEDQDHGTGLAFLQRDAVTRKAFGCTCMTNISTRNYRLEIGHTWLAKSHRKTPANTEGKLLLLTHAFETMKAVRVQFKVDLRNEAAQRAMERIGAVREGVMRNERILSDGFIRDAAVYSIIDREWPEVKKRLNGFLWNRNEVEPAVPLKPAPPRIPGLEPPVLRPRPAHPSPSHPASAPPAAPHATWAHPAGPHAAPSHAPHPPAAPHAPHHPGASQAATIGGPRTPRH